MAPHAESPNRILLDAASYSTEDLKTILGIRAYLKLIREDGLEGVEMDDGGRMRYRGSEVNDLIFKRPRVKPASRVTKRVGGDEEAPAASIDARLVILAARFLG